MRFKGRKATGLAVDPLFLHEWRGVQVSAEATGEYFRVGFPPAVMGIKLNLTPCGVLRVVYWRGPRLGSGKPARIYVITRQMSSRESWFLKAGMSDSNCLPPSEMAQSRYSSTEIGRLIM